MTLTKYFEVSNFINQLEYNNSLENIIKMQEMNYIELSEMISTHFAKYKKIELNSNDIKTIIDEINKINAVDILKDIHAVKIETELEEVTYKSDYLNNLKNCLEKFIAYATTYVYDQNAYGTSRSKHNRYLELAIHLRSNLHNIGQHIHKFCFSHDGIVFPASMLESLYNYRKFCYRDKTYNTTMNFNTLEEQNNNARNHVHYDFSVKKIKTFN